MNDNSNQTSQEYAVVEETDHDGRLLMRAETVGGVLQGKMTRFDPESAVQTLECHFSGGLLNGLLRARDPGGEVVQECEYRGGRLHGPLKVFVHGRCVSEQSYMNGELSGPTQTYDEAGHLSARLSYVDGELEGVAHFFHEGVEVRRAQYKAGLLHGPSVDYNAQGRVVQSCNYDNNLLDGVVTRYWPNGEVMEEQLYSKGRPLDEPKRFDDRRRASAPDQDRGSLLDRFQRWLRGD